MIEPGLGAPCPEGEAHDDKRDPKQQLEHAPARADSREQPRDDHHEPADEDVEVANRSRELLKNPPILISVLGFFAGLAGVSFLFFGLRVLGFDWFGAFGDLPEYDDIGLWGWLAVATGIAWLLVAVGLWGLQSWARTAAMIIAGFALFEAALAFFQFPGSGLGFAMAIMPGLILLYLMSADVKVAFAENDPATAM